MKLRRFSLKSLSLFLLFLLLLFSLVMTSSDLRSFLYRLTKLDGDSGVAIKDTGSVLPTATQKIVNRLSLKIESQEEIPSDSSLEKANNEMGPQEAPDQTAASPTPASVTPTTQAATGSLESRVFQKPDRSPPKSYYTLHIQSFKNAAPAKSSAEMLTGKGYYTWWEKATIPDKGEWYRVYLGKQENKAEASALGKKLKAAGIIDYYAVHRIKEP